MTCALVFAVAGLLLIFVICAVVQERRIKARDEFIEELLKKDRP